MVEHCLRHIRDAISRLEQAETQVIILGVGKGRSRAKPYVEVAHFIDGGAIHRGIVRKQNVSINATEVNGRAFIDLRGWSAATRIFRGGRQDSPGHDGAPPTTAKPTDEATKPGRWHRYIIISKNDDFTPCHCDARDR